MAILEAKSVTIRFGGLTAVSNIDLKVSERSIHSIIGPNGAGKTTLFNAITGVYLPTEGKISFRGEELKEKLTLSKVLIFVAFGIFTGFSLLKMVNIQSLWERVIVGHYVYQEPFPWLTAYMDGIQFLRELPFVSGALPFLIGFVIGAAGSFVIWRGWRVTPNSVAKRGIARTFQNIRLFQNMTVLDNVLVGLCGKLKVGVIASALRFPKFFREQKEATKISTELLEFVGLGSQAEEKASSLAYGDQRRLEIARALALEPAVLLLDEPAAGMNPTESVELVQLIRKIRERGVTVVLIEHHMDVVMGISDTVTVLDHGEKIAEGTPDAVRCDPRVIEAYLGADAEKDCD